MDAIVIDFFTKKQILPDTHVKTCLEVMVDVQTKQHLSDGQVKKLLTLLLDCGIEDNKPLIEVEALEKFVNHNIHLVK